MTREEQEAAAAAIANARAMRRGSPPISNVLELLKKLQGGKLYDEVMEDAEEALKASEVVRKKHLGAIFGHEVVR